MSTVKISGAVVYPNATTYLPGKKLKEYILNAGGYMQNARKRAYVVYMNGQVATTRGSLFGKTVSQNRAGGRDNRPVQTEQKPSFPWRDNGADVFGDFGGGSCQFDG